MDKKFPDRQKCYKYPGSLQAIKLWGPGLLLNPDKFSRPSQKIAIFHPSFGKGGIGRI